MVVVQARQLDLLHSSSLSSPQVTSLLFDPHSLSLALMHSDSSFSLYPSLSPLSLSSSSLPPPQTLVPPPSSSATFLRLHNPNPDYPPRLLFLASAPYLGGAAVLLRFWILRNNSRSFAKAPVLCNQSDLRFDENKLAVVFAVNHGVSIKLVGSINVFAMYSVSNGKIWVFAVKMAGDEEDGVSIKLMKCAVIDCSVPVFSVSVSFGFLILGENNGVRVFPLRPLVKGRVKKHNHRRVNKNLNGGLNHDKLEGQRSNLPNGGLQPLNASDDFHSNSAVYSNSGVSSRSSKSMDAEGTVLISSNGHLEEKFDKHSNSAKLRSVKLRQDSREGGACFVAFKSKGVECFNSSKLSLKSAKAISIQLLSPNKFLILDSVGDLHLLCLSNPVPGSEIPCHMKQLTLHMKVQQLAVLPDISTSTCNQTTEAQNVWISDGHHTVHTMVVSDVDASVGESDKKDNDEKLMQTSVIQAIFANEKIQEIIPLAANAILILGQEEELCWLCRSLDPFKEWLSSVISNYSGSVCHYTTELLSCRCLVYLMVHVNAMALSS